MTAPNPKTADPLALARGFAIAVGGAVVISGALGWGRPGLLSAATGTVLSLVNVWALARLAGRAIADLALAGPAAAAARMTSALGAKTVVLLAGVWLLCRGGRLEPAPFALGLLVSVFALLGAGLWTGLARGVN
jgi:hypothetical protein